MIALLQGFFFFPNANPSLSFVDEDYATDWSTDSCGWSEEEAEADCGATDPFLSDDSTGAGTRGSEIVRCVCEVEEDDDFMIQVSAATLLNEKKKLKCLCASNTFVCVCVCH